MTEINKNTPRTVEEWIKSYHEDGGVIKRFVTDQVIEQGSVPISDEEKKIVTEMFERVLPHFCMWLTDNAAKDTKVVACIAGTILLASTMLTYMIRMSTQSPMKYPGAAAKYLDGLANTMGHMLSIAMKNDLGDIDTSSPEGVEALLKALAG